MLPKKASMAKRNVLQKRFILGGLAGEKSKTESFWRKPKTHTHTSAENNYSEILLQCPIAFVVWMHHSHILVYGPGSLA